MRHCGKTVVASVFAIVFCSLGHAQPLVDGNLTFYFDFDEIVTNAEDEKQFLDESGNEFNGTIHEGDPDVDIEPGTLTVNNETFWRGGGAAHFQQSTLADDLPVFVDLDGKHITDNFPERLPTSGLNDQFGLSIAAWLNLSTIDGGDQSVFQARTSSGGHGAPHFQVQGGGSFRMTFRDQDSSNVVDARLFPDGSQGGDPVPVDEWFHYAGTFDADEGLWTMYYNGEFIGEGNATGLELGDWGGQVEELGDVFAAGLGAVYDSGGRRLNGLMDELYIFNRGLTEEEIATLVTLPEPVDVPGDCDGDGVISAADLNCVTDIAARDMVLGAINTIAGDLEGDGAIAFSDFLILSANFGKEGATYTEGNIDLTGPVDFADFLVLSSNFGAAAGQAVPEPTTISMVWVGFLLAATARRRRR